MFKAISFILAVAALTTALTFGASKLLPNTGKFILHSPAQITKVSEANIAPAANKQAEAIKVAPSEEAPSKGKHQVLLLGSKNTLTLRGPIMEDSVGKLQKQIMEMSQKLSDSDTIYLVIDSPGGSVPDGLQLIDTINALPQKVKTVTMFSASMAFQTVQNLGERLITPSGTLMSHRASVGGMGGNISSDGEGELMHRLKALIRSLVKLDQNAADRMGMDLKKYQDMIHDEYWVDGDDAVRDHAADRVVLMRCGKDLLEETEGVDMQTFFGSVHLEFSKCPILSAPLRVDMSRAKGASIEDVRELRKFVNELTTDKEAFVKHYIVNNQYTKILRK